MNVINELKSSYKYVCNNSVHVIIDYEQLDNVIKTIDFSLLHHWLESNPFGILNMNTNEIINFLLVYHTIGDYCFWGKPKWKIITEDGELDGSYAIMYILLKRFEENKSFNMSKEEFKKMLEGNTEIPLLDDRYNNIMIMNNYLSNLNNDFYTKIKKYTCDKELFEYLINKLSYFKDESTYNNHKIYFYKRAQLLTSDILHILKSKDNIATDYSHLIGCADYKLPQVMRCYGIMHIDNDLAYKIDNNIELKENSEEEIEIRANCLEVIDYIYGKLNKKYSKMDINDYIWLLGQDKSKMTKPYHKTLTNHY